LSADVVARVMDMITVDLPRDQKLAFLDDLMGRLPIAQDGIRELRALQDDLRLLGIADSDYDFDFTMVRGLGYYTGPIFEAIIPDGGVGSVAGGGRYDDLIGLFRTDVLPTTGGSLGIERIIDVVEAFGLFPEALGGTVVQALVTVFSDDTRAESTRLAGELRAGGVRTELYLQDKPIGKQIGYADKKGVAVVALLGADEIAAGVVRYKRLKDGHEVTAPRIDAVNALKAILTP
jgi:histidyl-tRNA synthetase